MNNFGISFSPSNARSFIEKLEQFTHTDSLEHEGRIPVIVSHSEPVSQNVSNRAVKVLLRCFKEQIPQELSRQSVSALSHLSQHYQSCEELKAAEKLNRSISLVREACLFRFYLEHGNSDMRFKLGMYFLGTKIKANEQKARELFQLAAQDGNKEAWHQLACLHLMGNEVDRQKKAFECSSQAASLGDVSNMTYIGNCYLNGEGVDKDEFKAFEYFSEAAAAGDTEAQISLAHLCLKGEVVEKNEKKAFENYKLAAAQNNRQALFNLAISYELGIGTEVDRLEAIRCYECAAELGDMEALYTLGRRFSRGLGVEKNLSKAFHYYERAASAGHADAEYHLAICYMNGEGTEKDEGLAVQLLRESAAKGNAHALVTLGALYEQGGPGIQINERQAFQHYKMAAKKDKNHLQAQFLLAECFRFGRGVKTNKTKAVKFYTHAAANKNHQAQISLCQCNFSGEGVPKDERKAIELLAQFAAEGNPLAQYSLSKFYFFGEYVERDWGKAASLLKMASQQGDTRAQKMLEELRNASNT